MLLLRVRRRFRDLLGHGRRLDLKGWTFRISNSSALGLSNVFSYISSHHNTIPTPNKDNIRKLCLRKPPAAPQAQAVICFWVGSKLFHLLLRPQCRLRSSERQTAAFSGQNLRPQRSAIQNYRAGHLDRHRSMLKLSRFLKFLCPIDLFHLVMPSPRTSTSWWRILWVYLLANMKKHERNIKKRSYNNDSSLLC